LEDSLLTLSSKSVVLSAIKESEDARAAIVRWWNPTSKEVTTDLQLYVPVKRVALIKLNEEEITPLRAEQSHSIPTGPCGITTVRVEFK
jgi:alpha-mannosidase